jgi:hypothetical protein
LDSLISVDSSPLLNRATTEPKPSQKNSIFGKTLKVPRCASGCRTKPCSKNQTQKSQF